MLLKLKFPSSTLLDFHCRSTLLSCTICPKISDWPNKVHPWTVQRLFRFLGRCRSNVKKLRDNASGHSESGNTAKQRNRHPQEHSRTTKTGGTEAREQNTR